MLSFIPGPTFLFLYLGLLVATFVGLRHYHRSVARRPACDDLDVQLHPVEAAYLAGGAARAALTGLAILSKTGKLTVIEGTPVKFRYSGTQEVDSHPYMVELAKAVPANSDTDLRTVMAALATPSKALQDLLVKQGLAFSDSAVSDMRRATPLAYTPFGLVGFLRLSEAGTKPVGFLLLLIFVGFFSMVVAGLLRPSRTVKGDLVVESLKEKNAALGTTALARFSEIGAADAALAVALFGAGVLAGSPLDKFSSMAVSSSGGCGSGCGSSCGGGGCGGGGCGGGGCGG